MDQGLGSGLGPGLGQVDLLGHLLVGQAGKHFSSSCPLWVHSSPGPSSFQEASSAMFYFEEARVRGLYFSSSQWLGDHLLHPHQLEDL